MPGHLVLHGGGTTAPETTKTLIRHAGGPDALLIVLPQTSTAAVDKGVRSADWLRANGAKNVVVSSVTRPGDPAVLELARQIETTARGVWIPGGNQNRFMDLFGATPVPAGIRNLARRGGVAGGTSAGASLLGEWMPTGAGDAARLAHNAVETRPGVGALAGVIVDSHFLARTRTQRLLTMVLSRPDPCWGIGIDENGWAEVDLARRELSVRDGQVVIVRNDGPTRRDAAGRLAARDVRVTVLLPGETLPLSRR